MPAPYILNPGPSTWTGGTSFTNPANNAETADDWFAYNCTEDAGTIVSQVGTGLRLVHPTAATVNTGVYQPLADWADFVGKRVTVTWKIQGGSGGGYYGTIGIDDGVSFQIGAEESTDVTLATFTTEFEISSAASQLKLYLLKPANRQEVIDFHDISIALSSNIGLLQNSGFDYWDQGSSWTNAATDLQLANHWYSTGGGVDVDQDNDTLKLKYTSTAGKGVYQDFDITGLSGIVINYSVYAGGLGSVHEGPRFKILLDDGTTVYDSGLLYRTFNDGTPLEETITLPITASSTTGRFSIVWGDGEAFNLDLYFGYIHVFALFGVNLDDSITITEDLTSQLFKLFKKTLVETISCTETFFKKLNHFVRLTLSDATGIDDALTPPRPVQTSKGLTETIRLQDWIRRRLRHQHGQGRWRN